MRKKFFHGLVRYRKIDDNVGFVLRAGKFLRDGRFADSPCTFYQQCGPSVAFSFPAEHWSYILRLNLLAAMLFRVSVPYKCRKLSEIEKCFCGFLPENAKCLTWNLSGNAQCEGGVYTNLAGTLLAGSGF